MEAVQPPAKARERYPPTERGVRVRVYPNEEQARSLEAKCRARAIVWNWTCDVFDRSRVRAMGEDAHGLAIKCTRAEANEFNETRTPRLGETEAAQAARTLAERHERREGVQKHAPARRASRGSGNEKRRQPTCRKQGG